MIFQRLSASAARFNLRQSMQHLRDAAEKDEILISDNGEVNSNKQRYMRQIVIDFGFLIEHWEIENNNPSKKIIRDFNEYLFSGNYSSHFSFFIAWMIARLPDKDLVKFNMLLNYYNSNLKFNDYEKEWIIVSNFIKDIIHHITKAGEVEFSTKKYRDNFININSDIWFKEKSLDKKSSEEEKSLPSSKNLKTTPELKSKVDNIWNKIKSLTDNYLDNKNIDGLIGFYNWYLMIFLNENNSSKELKIILAKTLILNKINLDQLKKYNHTEKVFKLIKENSYEHEQKIISYAIFDKVCDLLIDLSFLYSQIANDKDKEEDKTAFKEAANNYKKLKELNKLR